MPAPPLPPRPRARPLVATDEGGSNAAHASASAGSEAVDDARAVDLDDRDLEVDLGKPALFQAGDVIAGKYRLERPAGFGGMAELWVATNQATRAEVCVKLLNPSGEDKDEAVERFHREARAAAKLSHRAIVRVFDLLELDEHGETTKERPRAYAIVMELLHGETLGDLIARRDKLPVAEALDLFLPIVSALAHAHRASVIHRDIKPDNIFLARDPDDQIIPKILDFGVSKLENAATITVDGVLLGTPSFMSPEQARGARKLDARSDVFSAGIVFYMMLSGKNPFDAGPFASVVDAVVRLEVPPVEGLVPEIWAVLQQALEKDPARRFNDATEMAIALRKASGRTGTTESTPIVAASSKPGSGVPSSPVFDVVVSDAPSSVSARPEPAGAKRRQAIVGGVIGVAAVLALVGGAASIRSSKLAEPAAQAAVLARPTAPAAPTTIFSAAPVAVPAVAPPPPSSELAAPAPSAEPKPKASARSAPTTKASGPGRAWKPGQEPPSARGPGF